MLAFINIKRIIYLAFLFILFFQSCQNDKYTQCNLNSLNLKGNVTKVETFADCSIPLTEMFYESVNPANVISFYDGNFLIEFDKNGNISRNVGYGIDRKVLFDIKNFSVKGGMNVTPGKVIRKKSELQVDKIETISSNGNVVDKKYISNNIIKWHQKAYYNNEGNLIRIIKKYTDFSDADTTFYSYSSFDKHGNWTKVNISYKGGLPRYRHDYTLIRQITYEGESSLPPLITNSKRHFVNKGIKTDFFSLEIKNYGRIRVPSYMTFLSNRYMTCVGEQITNGSKNKIQDSLNESLFMYVYNGSNAYASLSASQSYDKNRNVLNKILSSKCFDSELNNEFKHLYESQTSLSGFCLLKWYPYEIYEIAGIKTLKFSYYRYGQGSPIPVYSESFTIPMKNQYNLNLTFSYQANQRDRFDNDFRRVINSIQFY